MFPLFDPRFWTKAFVHHVKNSDTAPIDDAAAIAVDAASLRR